VPPLKSETRAIATIENGFLALPDEESVNGVQVELLKAVLHGRKRKRLTNERSVLYGRQHPGMHVFQNHLGRPL
jgi:hypothetical protein